jgi:hypothetical protein
MYVPNGEETLLRFLRDGQEFQMAVDDETYAHFLNDPSIEVSEEIMKFTRLPFQYDPSVPKELVDLSKGRSSRKTEDSE